MYLDDYLRFKEALKANPSSIHFEEWDLSLHSLSFHSQTAQLLPHSAQQSYLSPEVTGLPLSLLQKTLQSSMQAVLQVEDYAIHENYDFNYWMLHNHQAQNKVIILLHGLNEKEWLKYLPWAKQLAHRTQSHVLLFPLAFQMNRAPKVWGDNRLMNHISQTREQMFDGNTDTSFTNAALSTRLHFAPFRLFLSGFITYFDILQLTEQIKAGKIPHLNAQTEINLFGYSMGAFLAKVLLMANYKNWFTHSKAVLFCGGNLLSQMHLTSKYILDSEAHQAVQKFFLQHLDQTLDQEAWLGKLFDIADEAGAYFKSLLSDQHPEAAKRRKKRLTEISRQLAAFLLQTDSVMRPEDIQNTLQSPERDIPIPCHIFDFGYPYSHVNPFPPTAKDKELIDQEFSRIFEAMAQHYQNL